MQILGRSVTGSSGAALNFIKYGGRKSALIPGREGKSWKVMPWRASEWQDGVGRRLGDRFNQIVAVELSGGTDSLVGEEGKFLTRHRHVLELKNLILL